MRDIKIRNNKLEHRGRKRSEQSQGCRQEEGIGNENIKKANKDQK